MNRLSRSVGAHLASRRAIARALLATAAAIATVGTPLAPDAHAGDKAPSPIAAPDLPSRIAKAAELEKKDATALFRALHALGLGTQGGEPAAEAEFLAEYAVREGDRALRLTALWSARKLDPKVTSAIVRKSLDAGQKDVTRLSLAIECAGYVGTREDAPALIALLSHPSEIAASSAARALARFGAAKDVDEILDRTLKHPEQGVSDQGAWTVQDILKKQKVAQDKYDKIAGLKSDPRAIRASATGALIKDTKIDPWKWGDSLDNAVKLLAAAPDSIETSGLTADEKKLVDESLAWIRDNMPAGWLMFRSVVKKVSSPGLNSDGWLDLKRAELSVPLSFLAKSKEPRKVAYNLFRLGVLVFQDKIGEPADEARGWFPAIFDEYDLCVIAKLESCGPSGVQREPYVRNVIARAPWSGMQ